MGKVEGKLIFESTIPDALASSASTGGISSLDHKISDNSMEDNAIIISLFHESSKVFDRFWGVLWEKFEGDISEVGGEEDFWIWHDMKVKNSTNRIHKSFFVKISSKILA